MDEIVRKGVLALPGFNVGNDVRLLQIGQAYERNENIYANVIHVQTSPVLRSKHEGFIPPYSIKTSFCIHSCFFNQWPGYLGMRSTSSHILLITSEHVLNIRPVSFGYNQFFHVIRTTERC